jgi:hypothetical protein
MPLIAVNYLAVLGTAVVAMVLGALWYSPLLFGKAWMRLSGMSEEALKAAKEKGMGKTYTLNFVAVLVTSFVLAQFLGHLGVVSALDGANVAFWLWLGFFAPVMLGSVLWENKSWSLYVLNVAYYLVSLVVMGVILAVWL